MTMATLSSWLSAEVMHALGWALIHSLWQCLGLAALAAVLMAFSRRPSIRYLVATGTLVLMLAAPAATFFVLMRQTAPVHVLLHPSPAPPFFSASASMTSPGSTPVAPDAAPVPPHSQMHFDPARFLSPDFLPPRILPWLVGAWLCGVALLSLRLAGAFLLLEYRRPRQLNLPARHVLAVAHELQHQLGLTRAIRYLECNWLQAPAVIGWIRPIVLLPVRALTGLSEMQLRAVIAHELAHIRRLDAFVNLLQILVETLLFYHPAIWWLNRRIRAERELACDEIAVRLTGDRIAYAKALTLMAEWEEPPGLAMAANRGPLSGRILHILGHAPFGAGRRMLGVMGSILFLAAALGGANALFGIAAPIPPAQAKASPELVLRAGTPALDASLDKSQIEVTASRRAETLVESMRVKKLTVPRADLAALLPEETPLTPIPVMSSDPAASPPASDVLLAAASLVATRPKALTCALPLVADSATLQDVQGSDLKTVPVAINGKAKQFLLDIGTDPTQVSRATVADLALPDANRSLDTLYANDNRPADTAALTNAGYFLSVAFSDVKGADDYRSHVRIASFTMGDATGHDLSFTVAKDPELGRSKPYDGLMTGDFFRQYDVEVDFAQNKLNYLTPSSCTDPDQIVYWPHAAVAAIPMTNFAGKIQVEVSIQGHIIPAVIDTASSHTVMRRDIAELMLGFKADTPDMMPDGDVEDGVGLQVYRHTFSKISFAGGVTAYNVPALIQTNSMFHDINRTPVLGQRATFFADPRQRIPGLTLGMDVLSQLHLYAIHGQQTLYVTAAAQ
jgi:beta-lactamase regulating signal transducer with metallopeptidase domain